jgi:hypothetical protein
LELPLEKIRETLSILTYSPGNKANIWLSPLQKVKDKTLLILSALAFSNVIRFLELTTIRRNLPFSEIGRDFERVVKRQAKEMIGAQCYAGSAHVLPIRTFRRGEKFEEIDLALCIGETLFVIEIKYDHFPTEPFEIYHFVRGAHNDCLQASRKAAFILDYLENFQKERLIPSAIKSVFGIVLNNTMLLSGISLSGVPIIDFDILEDYLTNTMENSMMSGRAIYVGKSREVFYKSQDEFEEEAQAYFIDPPQIKPFEGLLSKVIFSRRGGPIQGVRGYDIAVYDLASNSA